MAQMKEVQPGDINQVFVIKGLLVYSSKGGTMNQQRLYWTRRGFLKRAALASGAMVLAACAPRPTPTPVIVEKIVKETVVVEKKVEVAKEVTKVVEKAVEKVVTPTPAPQVFELVLWDSNPDPVRTQVRTQALEDFAKKHPGVKGKYVPVPIAAYQQKLMTAIGSGNPPDVGDMWGSWVASYAIMGALLDLEPYTANWVLRDKWLPWLWKLAKCFDNKMYWLPSGQFVLGVYYRKDWVKELGMPDPWEQWKKGEWTWDALLKLCQAMTDPAKKRYGIALRGGVGSQMSLFTVMQCWLGGKWFDKDNNCLLNLPEGIEAVTFYADLYRKHKVAPPTCVTDGYQQIQTNFSTEVCGLYIHSADGVQWQYRNLRPDPFEAQKLLGTAPIPKGPAGSWQQLDGLGWAAFSQSKRPELAAQFIFDQVPADGLAAYIKQDKEANKPFGYSGWSFQTLDDFKRPEFLEHPHYPQIYETLLKTENTFINPFHLAEYNGITANKVTPEFQKILLGELDVKKAVDGWATDFTKAQKAFADTLAKAKS